ncbi:thermonuclease family protein [Chitinibacter sp. SCUT-21]|uniref:thermonuclease family protein n=1 Tax=Chitinibacter sp. SCUT-21 TaxID=2970891 RepID=UPI0035A69A12
MKHLLKIAFVATLFAATMQMASAEEPIKGRILQVIDGNTFMFMTKKDKQTFKVRLAYIDVPKLTQPYGPKSKSILEIQTRLSSLSSLTILGRDDKQQLVIARAAMLGDVDLGGFLLSLGGGTVIDQTPLTEDAKKWLPKYKSAQAQAKQAEVGMWADTYPVK